VTGAEVELTGHRVQALVERTRIVLAGMTTVQGMLLKASLAAEHDLDVVGPVEAGEVLHAVREHEAGVVIFALPAMREMECYRALQRDCPEVKVLLLDRSMVELYDLRRLSRDASGGEVVAAVRQLASERRPARPGPDGP
jgi:DNA-binding NarL/FixJ family response regulator